MAFNPVGSTGFGQEFTDAVRGDWGGAPYRNIMDGVNYVLQRNPWIDGNRACACGGSYGGYMVNWINSQNNFFKCLVNHDGTFSVTGKYYSTDEIFFQEWEFYGPPFDPAVSSIWNKWNPQNYAGSMKTPMLVIHGGLDYRVPITEGISTFTNLQRRGIPSRLLYFPLENHWVLNPLNAIMWNDEVLGWLDQWTNNTAPNI